jgi:hypothetical protein
MHAIRLEARCARWILVYGGMSWGVLADMQWLEVRDRLHNEGLRLRAGVPHACMRHMRTRDDLRRAGGGGNPGQQRSRLGKEISSGRAVSVIQEAGKEFGQRETSIWVKRHWITKPEVVSRSLLEEDFEYR